MEMMSLVSRSNLEFKEGPAQFSHASILLLSFFDVNESYHFGLCFWGSRHPNHGMIIHRVVLLSRYFYGWKIF